MTRVPLLAAEICRAKSKPWVPESSIAELIPNHMGSLLGYGRQYRWQFRFDSDEFQLAVLRPSRHQQLAIHSGAFSGQHFDSVRSSRQPQ